MNKGFVYILRNPSFQENWVKIGMTENLDKRIKDLSNKTCLPYSYEIYAYCKTCKYKELESQIHRLLDEYAKLRVVPNREFFQIVPSKAWKELKFLAATIDDAEFFAPEEKENQLNHTTPAPPFRFSMVHLKPGEELIFEPSSLKVVVAEDNGDNKIEYNGGKYTLSGFCKKYMPDNKRNKADAYQGPAFFSYNGVLLSELRKKLASKLNEEVFAK